MADKTNLSAYPEVGYRIKCKDWDSKYQKKGET